MKVSKTLLQTMLVAVTTGLITSCEKPTVEAQKGAPNEKAKTGTTGTTTTPDSCIACGMG